MRAVSGRTSHYALGDEASIRNRLTAEWIGLKYNKILAQKIWVWYRLCDSQ